MPARAAGADPRGVSAARGGDRVREREAAGVEGAPEDRARIPGRGDRADVVERGDPRRGDDPCPGCGGRDLGKEREVGSFQQAVSSDRGDREERDPLPREPGRVGERGRPLGAGDPASGLEGLCAPSDGPSLRGFSAFT